MIFNSIYRPIAMVDIYAKGIIDVLFKGISAEEAIDRCENLSESSSYEEKVDIEEPEAIHTQVEVKLNHEGDTSD